MIGKALSANLFCFCGATCLSFSSRWSTLFNNFRWKAFRACIFPFLKKFISRWERRKKELTIRGKAMLNVSLEGMTCLLTKIPG